MIQYSQYEIRLIEAALKPCRCGAKGSIWFTGTLENATLLVKCDANCGRPKFTPKEWDTDWNSWNNARTDVAAFIRNMESKEDNSHMSLEEKIETNTWDHIDDFLQVYNLMKLGKWLWYKNSLCKYVELRIDMRDGGCIIKNGGGVRIDPKQLAEQ